MWEQGRCDWWSDANGVGKGGEGCYPGCGSQLDERGGGRELYPCLTWGEWCETIHVEKGGNVCRALTFMAEGKLCFWKKENLILRMDVVEMEKLSKSNIVPTGARI